MTVPDDPTFDSDVRRRMYEYVERHGAVTPQQVLDDVRIEATNPDSKPSRSALTTKVRMTPATFASHLAALVKAGYVVKDGRTLRIGVESEDETIDLDDGRELTIRLAREADSDDVASLIRDVASERTHIVAESVAEALDDEPVVRHTNQQSRVIFVATMDEAHDDGERDDTRNRDEDVIGWVHVDGPEREKLRHTAELTVGVREEYRGQGIGSRLLDRGLEWAREHGYRKIYQSVPATNEDAIAFLQEKGWDVEAERKDHYQVGENLVDEVMLATWVDR